MKGLVVTNFTPDRITPPPGRWGGGAGRRGGPAPRRLARTPGAGARGALALAPEGSSLLSPRTPTRPEKRVDRARALAEAAGAELLLGGSIEPEQMPLWLNAASAVLVTSDYEGFGLTALEALSCGVPVLSTAVGIAPHAVAGIPGCLVGPFDVGSWLPLA